MKRSLLATLVILIVAAALSPLVVGKLVQSDFSAQIEQVNLNAQGNFIVALESYEAGWRSSTALVSARMSDAFLEQMGQGEEPVPEAMRGKLTLAVDITHGPWLGGEEAALGWARFEARPAPDTEFGRFMTAWTRDGESARALGTVAFSGRTDLSLSVPEMAGDVELANLRIAAWTLSGSVIGPRYQATVAVPHVHFMSPEVTMSWENVEGEWDFERLVGDLGIGEGRFTLGSLEMTSAQVQADGPFIRMDNLTVSSVSSLDEAGEMMAMDLTYRLEHGQFTEQWEVEAAELRLTAEGIDAALLRELNQRMRAPGAPTDQAAVLQAIGPELLEMLAGDFVVQLDPLRFTLNGAQLRSWARLKLEVPADGPTPSLNNPMFWQQAARVTFDAEADKPLVRDVARSMVAKSMPPDVELAPEQVEAVVAGMVAQGMLAESEEVYSLKFEYAGPQAMRLNGRPFPPQPTQPPQPGAAAGQ